MVEQEPKKKTWKRGRPRRRKVGDSESSEEEWDRVEDKRPKNKARQRQDREEEEKRSLVAARIQETTFDEVGTMLIGKIGLTETPESTKIAAFDLDWTLIQTRWGAKFARNIDDWKPWDPRVITKLNSLVDDGYRIVIFTNQGGVAIGKTTISELRIKF